jgi:hypothetical protein
VAFGRSGDLVSRMDSFDAERLDRLERQVSLINQRLGIAPEIADITPSSQFPPAFYEAIQRGEPIHAIKIYRQVTGADLRTAKNAVEAIVRGERF